MRYFYIETSRLTNTPPVISGSDAKHIRTVLRLNSGDIIRLFDNTGYNYEARIIRFQEGNVELEILGSYASKLESKLQITVAQALLKEGKMDTIVRQLTELGVKKWIPFTAERTVPKIKKGRIQARVERWKKIAAESVKQCGRGLAPEISLPVSYEAMLDAADHYDLKVIFWEGESVESKKLSFQSTQKVTSAFVILGPEGGFAIQEVLKAQEKGFVTASLGPRILKADTASIAACTLIQYLFGDMGGAIE